MSTDKSDYVRFELRLETEFSGKVDAWIKANRDGTPKSVIVREALEEFMRNRSPDGVTIPDELMADIDKFRKKSRPPHARQTIVTTAIKDYIAEV